MFVDHFHYNQDMCAVGRQRSLQGPRYSIYMYTFAELLPVFAVAIRLLLILTAADTTSGFRCRYRTAIVFVSVGTTTSD